MRNLLDFLIKYSHWFLFVLLIVVCLGLLFRFSYYQQGIFFSSANTAVGKVYEISGGIKSYFHLKSINEELVDRNVELEAQVSNLENTLREIISDSIYEQNIRNFSLDKNYRVYKAHVINNSVNKLDNYITLDKGEKDGIFPEMGVIDGRGVVGFVYLTSSNYSVVLSLLNSKSNLNCRIKGSAHSGYIKWGGGDSRYAYLKDLPRHAEVNVNDTVITSGHSAFFPEGVMVGTIDEIAESQDGLSYQLKIKLSTDFGRLDNVRVLAREGQPEQHNLEKRTIN